MWQWLCRRRAGATTVQVALMIVVLLGAAALSVDVGRIYQERSRLLQAVDAAALAGAGAMSPDAPDTQPAAREMAMQFAQLNGLDPASTVVDFPGTARVRVRGQWPVDLWFARVLGFKALTLRASATAMKGWLRQAPAGTTVPLGILEGDFIELYAGRVGEAFVIKVDARGEHVRGNFAPLDLRQKERRSGGPCNPGGAAEYREDLAHGARDAVAMGDWVYTQTGNAAGPTREAMDQRAQDQCAAPAAQSHEYDPRCRRWMIVPIISGELKGESQPVQIAGFAAFYVQSYTASGEITAVYWMPINLPGGVPGGAPYGVTAVRVVE